ncbi:hypothetical protein RFI_38204, partial [Reticulomyxa filosa]
INDFAHVWPYANNIYTQMLSGSFANAYYNQKYLQKHYQLLMTHFEHLFIVQGIAINQSEHILYYTPIQMPHPFHRVMRLTPSPNETIEMMNYTNMISYLRYEMDIVRENLLTYYHFLLARHHLLQMSWVGLTETFDESMRHMNKLWGLCSDNTIANVNSNKWYRGKGKFNGKANNKDNNVDDANNGDSPDANANPNDQRNRISSDNKDAHPTPNREYLVTDEELKDIAKFNAYDVQLYDLAKVLFLQQQIVILATRLDGRNYLCIVNRNIDISALSRHTINTDHHHHSSLPFSSNNNVPLPENVYIYVNDPYTCISCTYKCKDNDHNDHNNTRPLLKKEDVNPFDIVEGTIVLQNKIIVSSFFFFFALILFLIV